MMKHLEGRVFAEETLQIEVTQCNKALCLQDIQSSEEESVFIDLGLKISPPVQLFFKTKYWSYAPRLIPNADEIFSNLLPQLEKVCSTYMIEMYGKSFESRRISCVFSSDVKKGSNAKSSGFNYTQIPTYEWSQSPKELLEIRELLEKFFGYRTDYVLCHIYRGLTSRKTISGKVVEELGRDYIGWHNDKEALNSEIYSISLGTSRRFKFRSLKGYTDELLLRSGDVVHMFGPRKGQKSCQNMYKHQLPQMSVNDLVAHIEAQGLTPPKGRKTRATLIKYIKKYDVPPTRINLTFRQFEGFLK